MEKTPSLVIGGLPGGAGGLENLVDGSSDEIVKRPTNKLSGGLSGADVVAGFKIRTSGDVPIGDFVTYLKALEERGIKNVTLSRATPYVRKTSSNEDPLYVGVVSRAHQILSSDNSFRAHMVSLNGDGTQERLGDNYKRLDDVLSGSELDEMQKLALMREINKINFQMAKTLNNNLSLDEKQILVENEAKSIFGKYFRDVEGVTPEDIATAPYAYRALAGVGIFNDEILRDFKRMFGFTSNSSYSTITTDSTVRNWAIDVEKVRASNVIGYHDLVARDGWGTFDSSFERDSIRRFDLDKLVPGFVQQDLASLILTGNLEKASSNLNPFIYLESENSIRGKGNRVYRLDYEDNHFHEFVDASDLLIGDTIGMLGNLLEYSPERGFHNVRSRKGYLEAKQTPFETVLRIAREYEALKFEGSGISDSKRTTDAARLSEIFVPFLRLGNDPNIPCIEDPTSGGRYLTKGILALAGDYGTRSDREDKMKYLETLPENTPNSNMRIV